MVVPKLHDGFGGNFNASEILPDLWEELDAQCDRLIQDYPDGVDDSEWLIEELEKGLPEIEKEAVEYFEGDLQHYHDMVGQIKALCFAITLIEFPTEGARDLEAVKALAWNRAVERSEE